MAHLTNTISYLVNQNQILTKSIENMKDLIQKKVTFEASAVSQTHVKEPAVNYDDLKKSIMDEVIKSVKDEIHASEAAFMAKMELFIIKSVKERVDINNQFIKTQLQNEVDLKIEELKEDLTKEQEKQFEQMRSSMLTSDAINTPPSITNGKHLDIDVSKIDIDKITKDILGFDDAASMSSVSSGDISFKKKSIRKTLPR